MEIQGRTLKNILNDFDINKLLNKSGVTFIDTKTKQKFKMTAIQFGKDFIITVNNREDETVPMSKVKNFIAYTISDGDIEGTDTFLVW